MRLLLISPPAAYATKRLVQEADQADIALTVKDIQVLHKQDYQIDSIDFEALYIRQAYVNLRHKASVEQLQGLIGLAVRFQKTGKVVVDAAIAAGDLGSGKLESLQTLRQHNLPVPATQLLSNTELVNHKFPIIAKWNFGFGGHHTYLIKTAADLQRVNKRYPQDELILQQFVPAEFEYKVVTVGYKSLPVVIKLPTNHNKFLPDLGQPQVIAANQALEVVRIAEAGAKVLGRELAKTDILEANGQFIFWKLIAGLACVTLNEPQIIMLPATF